MAARINILVTFAVFAFLLVLPEASSHFVCGKVNNSEQGMSSNWYPVKVYPKNHENDFLNCRISPDGGKYCGDVESLNHKWEIGDEYVAEVFDPESGYFAGPVAVSTTGEGYDIFPEMKLKKAIIIHNPDKKIFISNKSNHSFLLNASFRYPYTDIDVSLNNKSVLSGNYSSIKMHLDAISGHNRLFINSSKENGDQKITEKKELYFIESYNFSRVFCYSGECSEKSVKGGRELEVRLNLTLDTEIKNIVLKEYVPTKWEILSDEQIIPYSDHYNIITWNVSGKKTNKTYTLRSPSRRFFPRRFFFKTELEKELIDKSRIIVRGFVPVFIKPPNYLEEEFYEQRSIRIFNDLSYKKPLVVNNVSGIDKIAIFPNKTREKTFFSLMENVSIKEPERGKYSYFFNTDMNEKEIEKVFLDFGISREELEHQNYNEFDLYLFRENNWEKSDLNYSLNEDEIRYKGYVPGIKGFTIVSSENPNNSQSFLSRILNFLKEIFNKIFG